MGRATCNVIIAGLYLGDTSWHDINQTGCLIGPRRERNNPEDLTLANDVQAGAIGAPDSCQTGAPVPNAFLESFCFAKHSLILLEDVHTLYVLQEGACFATAWRRIPGPTHPGGIWGRTRGRKCPQGDTQFSPAERLAAAPPGVSMGHSWPF